MLDSFAASDVRTVKSNFPNIARQLRLEIQPICQRAAPVLAALALLLSARQAVAQDSPVKLFLDFASTSPPTTPPQAVPARFARLNSMAVAWLSSSAPATPLRLSVNLSSNENYTLLVEHRELLEAGRVVCRGRLEGHPGSYVTLAVSGPAMAGSVFIPARGMFQILHAGEGWQRIVQADVDHLPRCGVKSGSRSTTLQFSEAGAVFQAASAPATPTNVIIDLLVVYTPDARDGAGGTDGMNALIDAAVAEANLAFENSQVNAQLRLAHRAEVNYTETGDISEDLDHLESDDANNPLSVVRQLRGLYRADLVCLITERTGGPYGLANQMHEVELEFGEIAFSIVQRQFAISYQALAHELGHNMGCQHDRETSPTGGAFDFSHAYRFEVDGTLYHTVMAYQPGLPIAYYSNPDVSFLGVPTGIAPPDTNSANNARTINLTAATVARFDSLTPTGTPPRITLTAPTNGAVFIVPAVLELSADATDDDGQVVKVEFFVNGKELAEQRSPPFHLFWTNGTPGTFSFRAQARDDAGWTISSARVAVLFTYPPPVIDAANSRLLPDGSFLVRVRGVDGQAFRLDASPDLAEWSPLTTDSILGDIFDFVDLQATNSPTRFYRALPTP